MQKSPAGTTPHPGADLGAAARRAHSPAFHGLSAAKGQPSAGKMAQDTRRLYTSKSCGCWTYTLKPVAVTSWSLT